MYNQEERRTIKKKRPKDIKEKEEVQVLISKLDEFDETIKPTTFKELPLSRNTLKGLNESGYTVPTEIQSEAIGLALKGHDILGAAKTGSGKTLAFLIPLIEKLFRERWTHLDGLGGLIITPTRELAYQIFEVINKIGKYHDFSVGLVIGGKDLKFERGRMNRCNIIICTPGRLLQHMSENYLFNCDNMRMLVLDEADRILDMGFAKTLDAIVENLPTERQTLLFSATQTKSVKDLARLSLVSPKYVSVHENATTVTPESLTQSYTVCEAHQKLDLLWSFLKSHSGQKILIFVSTCKQAKYIYELFVRLKAGTPIMALYGSLHQLRRMQIYKEFCNKQKAVLIATDIASRGLDFPAVNWVVQLDCPENTNQYIHRAGRTARYEKDGESLLVLLPSEEKSMIAQLEAKKVPIEMIDVNPSKMKSIQRKAEALCARDVAFKESAQRAFKSYIKDVFLMKDKTVFNVTAIDKDAFARSLGLLITPRIRFLENKNLGKGENKTGAPTMATTSDKEDKLKDRKITLDGNASDESDGEELFIAKKVPTNIPEIQPISAAERLKKEKIVTQAALAKKVLRKNLRINRKVVFDENGQPIEEFPMEQKSEKVKLLDEKCNSGIDIAIAKEIMEEEDKIDKELQRKLIKEKHREKRLKEKEERRKKAEEAKERARKKKSKTEPEAGDENEHEHEQAEEKESDSDESDRDERLAKFIDELPDPDLYYGDSEDDENDTSDDEEENSEETEQSENEETDDDDTPPQKKRKLINQERLKDLPLSLEDTEALAMHLIDE